jgi:ligand-binding sensor domain-containing protein
MLHPIRLFLLIAFLFIAVFSSCNGQVNSVREASNKGRNSLGEIVSTLPEGISTIFQDAGGNHWFGGDGVYKFDGEQITRFGLEDGLCGLSVIGIQQDQSGHLYFDTTEGISKFDGIRFTTLEIVSGDAAEGQWKLSPDDLWFRAGWERSGPLRFDGTTLYALELPKTNQAELFFAAYPHASFNPYGLYSIYKDRAGKMWFGTSSLGLCMFDGEKVYWMFEDELTTISGGGSFGIRSIFQDANESFWICNTHYRYQVSPQIASPEESEELVYTRREGVGEIDGHNPRAPMYFMAISEDKNGDLWMVTHDDGVSRFDGTNLSHYPIQQDGTDVNLFTCYTDNEGVVWLGSHNAGAWRFNGEVFEKFEP